MWNWRQPLEKFEKKYYSCSLGMASNITKWFESNLKIVLFYFLALGWLATGPFIGWHTDDWLDQQAPHSLADTRDDWLSLKSKCTVIHWVNIWFLKCCMDIWGEWIEWAGWLSLPSAVFICVWISCPSLASFPCSSLCQFLCWDVASHEYLG